MKVRVFAPATIAPTTGIDYTGLYATRNHIPLIARVLLSGLFLWSGVNKVVHPIAIQEYMAMYGMPVTGLFLVAAVLVEVGGGLFLLLGFYPRLAAAFLTGFTLVATLIFHTKFADQIQQIMFMKNLSIIGGLLMVIQHGAGSIALPTRKMRE